MSNEIERSIIATLIHNPELIESVSANSDWFADINCRALFEAISEAHGVGLDTLTIMGKAKSIEPKFNLNYQQVVDLDCQFVTTANLQNDIASLHKLAAKRELDRAINEYQENPFGDTLLKLNETIGEMTKVDEKPDTGSLEETMEKTEYMLDHSVPDGIKTFPKLDNILSGGLYGSMLFTIGARPSIGKTAYSVNLAYRIMENDANIQVDYFTLEMSKREMLNRFISLHTGITSQLMRNPADNFNDIQKTMVRKTFDWLKQHKLRVYDKIPTLGGIIQTIKENASNSKIGGYVAIIDYIGLVEVENSKADRWIAVGEITRQLKMVSSQYDIPVIALAQLNRGIESRTDRTPQLSDLRESGSIEQDSNVVAFLHRPDDNHREIEQLVVQKNREGMLGRIDYHFNGAEMLFQELNT